MSQDYYKILGVSKSASQEEIKKAYHKLAKQHHPDVNGGDSSADKKFKEISSAYEVLKDEQKRAAYDRFGHENFQNRGSASHGNASGFHADVNDIFSDIFGDIMGGGSKRRSRNSSKVRGSDLRYNINISLEEAFKGVDKNIEFTSEVKCGTCHGSGSESSQTMSTCDICGGNGVIRRQQGFFAVEQECNKCEGSGQIIKNPCKKCRGYGRYNQRRNLMVNIPAGIEDGTRIRLVGEGDSGIRGGGSGDLYIAVSVKPHDLYKIDGINLHCKVPINFVTAIIGGEVHIPTIEGEKISLKIPAGTQNGDQLKLKNKGMSKIRSSVRGDMFVHIHVEIPKNLTKRQKELLEEFNKEEFGDREDENSFFNKMKNLWS